MNGRPLKRVSASGLCPPDSRGLDAASPPTRTRPTHPRYVRSSRARQYRPARESVCPCCVFVYHSSLYCSILREIAPDVPGRYRPGCSGFPRPRYWYEVIQSHEDRQRSFLIVLQRGVAVMVAFVRWGAVYGTPLVLVKGTTDAAETPHQKLHEYPRCVGATCENPTPLEVGVSKTAMDGRPDGNDTMRMHRRGRLF